MTGRRCPDCGSVADHLVTDIVGHPYYQCQGRLTMITGSSKELFPSSRAVPCETILDERGHKVTGTIAYSSEGKIHTLAVTDGKERL